MTPVCRNGIAHRVKEFYVIKQITFLSIIWITPKNCHFRFTKTARILREIKTTASDVFKIAAFNILLVFYFCRELCRNLNQRSWAHHADLLWDYTGCVLGNFTLFETKRFLSTQKQGGKRNVKQYKSMKFLKLSVLWSYVNKHSGTFCVLAEKKSRVSGDSLFLAKCQREETIEVTTERGRNLIRMSRHFLTTPLKAMELITVVFGI